MEAVELYPAESRLVDNANQWHLWCVTGFRFPFGFAERLVSEETPGVTQLRIRGDRRPAPGLGPQLWCGARAGARAADDDEEAALVETQNDWRGWIAHFDNARLRGRTQVRRSLITLKALIYAPTGGLVAAPTTSLPEVPGGR